MWAESSHIMLKQAVHTATTRLNIRRATVSTIKIILNINFMQQSPSWEYTRTDGTVIFRLL
jgi:hypothetical protein